MRTVVLVSSLSLLAACARTPSAAPDPRVPVATDVKHDQATADLQLGPDDTLAAMPAMQGVLSLVAFLDHRVELDMPADAELAEVLRRLPTPKELSTQFSLLVANDYGMARALAAGFDRHGLWTRVPSLADVRKAWNQQLEAERGKIVESKPRARGLLLGVSPYGLEGLDTLSANQVVVVGARDRPVSLYAVADPPIRALWPVSDDEVLVVSGGGTQPGGGAIIPPVLLGDLTVARLRLRDLSVDEAIVRVDEAHAVHFELADSGLRVVTRDHYAERHRVARCRLDGSICDRFEPAPKALTIGGIEVTAHTSYAPSDARIEANGVVHRQTQSSADGRWKAFVTQCTHEYTQASYAAHRALSIVSDGKPRIVAEGWGWFHARWLDDRHLAFELDPRIRDRYREIHDALAREYASFSGGYEDWKPPPHGADANSIALVQLHLSSQEEATRPQLWNVVEQRVGIFDVETGAIEILVWPQLRIGSSFTMPPMSSDHGHFLEVAPMGSDPHGYSDDTNWRCVGPADRPLGECSAQG